MYIQEIIVDGFKSYATRTVVSGFDPHFNAITGLNGSGKSNILDSICFVLGISNLSQVRVGNLQELVYKQGQAGVTKASVTIVFNNSDTAGSPVGYEQHKQITVTRQVVIGGKNKYMINGVSAQQSQVQNLFHSVQLNVNNPHFLIMQGRITKVLNMKPPETLSMIEEAAGTRMFETKKQAAQKTIEKKQLKVDELTQVMESTITPQLEKLKGDRHTYQTWSSNNIELEKLERFCIAHDFMDAKKKVIEAKEDNDKLNADIAKLDAEQVAKKAEVEKCAEQTAQLEAQRESESEGEFQALKRTEQELSKELVVANSTWTNKKDSLTIEKKALAALSEQVVDAEKTLSEKRAELQTCYADSESKEVEANAADSELVSIREKYQNACAGVADETNADLLSLPEQVGAWEKRAREALSQLQQGNMRADHAKSSLKELRKTLKTQQTAHSQVLKDAESLQTKVAEVERNLASLSYDEAEEANLRTRHVALQRQVSMLQDTVENLQAQLNARLSFEFKDPERGFDRNRVKGIVAKLVRVNDSIATTALEIAAGGKLYQIVTDNEKTAQLLLEKGQLKKRVTILPLNKISYSCASADKVARAKQIASARGGRANLALELVGYEDEVRRAMEFIFGNTIICDTSDIAQAIAFDRDIRCRTVTFEGDTFDPSGTLTGGSKNNLGELLAKLDRLTSSADELDNKQNELNTIGKALHRIDAMGQRAKDLAAELDLRRHALSICESKMAGSSYMQITTEIDRLEAEVSSQEQEAQILKVAHEKAVSELAKLKDAESNIKKQQEKAMKEMETQVKAITKKSNALKAEAAAARQRKDLLTGELSACEKELFALKEQVLICQQGLQRLSEEVEDRAIKVAEKKAAYEQAKLAVSTKQQELNRCSKEIKALEGAKAKALKAIETASLESRKLQHQRSELEKNVKSAEKLIDTLLKKHSWINQEEEFFGQSGGNFDFQARDPTKCQRRLNELKSAQDNISKRLNKKVMGMIEKAETEYEELRRKREVILNDKAKIGAVIDELDVKKAQALQSTWVKVNRDFGSIFSTLLPGTHAKLEPLEGCSVMEGLEVKVAFNGVWKDSLTELSGGQRSLLALSLILSLLLFKPAPMYILDEVDAALDLSHTQNIGLMLRTHFSASQFIVVSLKEGMFNNANVIFKTRFVDGISTVSRTVTGSGAGKAKELALLENDVQDEDENIGPQKKRGKAVTSTVNSKASKGKGKTLGVEA